MTQTNETAPGLNPEPSQHNNSPEAIVRDYLTELYGQEPDGLIGICRTDDWRGQFFDTIEGAVKCAVEMDALGVHGVYHRSTTLAYKPPRRGEAKDSAAVYFFALDMDVHGPGHKATDLPPDREALEKILKVAEAPVPTAWVFSGGGYYPQWRFHEPMDVRDAEARTLVVQSFVELADRFIAAAKSLGFKLDNVRDLARVFRIPGTTNRKAEPVVAAFEGVTGPKYYLTELMRTVKAPVIPPVTPAAPLTASDGLFDDAADTSHSHTPRQARERMEKEFEKLKAALGPENFNVPINAFAKFCSHFPTLIDREKCATNVGKALKAHGRSVDDNDYRQAIDSAYKSTEAGDWVATIIENPNWNPDGEAYAKWEQANGWAKPTAEQEAATAQERAKRRRVDLTPFMDGTYVAPEPSVGECSDGGAHLLYPARWHTVMGLTTAGKSWFALWHVVAELRAGNTVVYAHFEETNPGGTLARLKLMAPELTMEDVQERFWWLDCSESWSPGEFGAALPESASLVVLDGINEAAGQMGQDPNAPAAVTAYKGMFVNPSTKLGAAVLSLGHPPKARDRQGERHGFGSTAWLDVVDGVGFRMVASAKSPIQRGKDGLSMLYTVKDRYGQVERIGQIETEGDRIGWYKLGAFHVDSTEPDLIRTRLGMLSQNEDGSTKDKLDELSDAILKILGQEKHAEGLNQRALRDALKAASVKHTTSDVAPALMRAEEAGKVTSRPGARSSTIYALMPAPTGSDADLLDLP